MLGGNPNLKDGEGKVPLHHAVMKNNARNVEVRVLFIDKSELYILTIGRGFWGWGGG